MFGLFEKTKLSQDLDGREFEVRAKDESSVLLDVRTKGEYSEGHVPDALNIDIMSHTFQQKILNLDKSKTYLVYCRSGSRSAQACSILNSSGFSAYNLSRGISAWPGKIVRG